MHMVVLPYLEGVPCTYGNKDFSPDVSTSIINKVTDHSRQCPQLFMLSFKSNYGSMKHGWHKRDEIICRKINGIKR